MLHSWYDPQRVLKDCIAGGDETTLAQASFLVRPAEGIERRHLAVVCHPLLALHSWYDPQRVLKDSIIFASNSAILELHSWYDPQRVLKEYGLLLPNDISYPASFLVRPAEGIESGGQPLFAAVNTALHSWYDPQRVLKAPGFP